MRMTIKFRDDSVRRQPAAVVPVLEAVLVAILGVFAADPAGAQPMVELPPAAAADPAPPQAPRTRLRRESAIENALESTPIEGSAYGGYGELTLNIPGKYLPDPADHAIVDLRRFVLFFG